MTLPVTGPFAVVIPGGNPKIVKRQWKYKQKKPIDRPLTYKMTNLRNLRNSRNGYYIGEAEALGTSICPNTQGGYQFAINDCASKLRSQVSDQAIWAANLAEYRSTLGMMSQRLVQVSRLARGILKRDPHMIWTSLGKSKGPITLKSLSKGAADTWLEFSFGWKPLVQDIYTGVDLLQNPIKAVKIKASRTYEVSFVEQVGGGLIGTKRTVTGKQGCKMGCEVTISNPNLYLANNLGLANPALVIWELVPFSFVVDWFVSVGQFLENGSAWLGLTVTKPYSTWGRTVRELKVDWNAYDSVTDWFSIADVAYIERRLSILESAIIVKPQKLWGWERAANAASVATQLLKRF